MAPAQAREDLAHLQPFMNGHSGVNSGGPKLGYLNNFDLCERIRYIKVYGHPDSHNPRRYLELSAM